MEDDSRNLSQELVNLLKMMRTIRMQGRISEVGSACVFGRRCRVGVAGNAAKWTMSDQKAFKRPDRIGLDQVSVRLLVYGQWVRC